MSIPGTLIYLFSLAVLSSSAVQDETLAAVCTSHIQLFGSLSAQLQEATQCTEAQLSQLNMTQTAAMLHSLRTLTNALHKHQLTACQGAEPSACPQVEVHTNGGVVCATIKDVIYCKPMCNNGYDFNFLRRRRLYEVCSGAKNHKWTTSYIGGNKLAVCHESSVQISGAETSYFPEGLDCMKTKSIGNLREMIINKFLDELKAESIDGEPEYTCLVCG
ncbi:uncharacterized protein si:ch1073-126c3.2 [Lampris incognitus]|uniref:uncharacterized protein si:ch1073-126c3.2 n=1 Tax=Lampris incognitus TaxID=2546036 RepID=UPI0024B5B030|nr:uncharacterized protein si:ch1073-126c3.2 [Lampris incognitus]